MQASLLLGKENRRLVREYLSSRAPRYPGTTFPSCIRDSQTCPGKATAASRSPAINSLPGNCNATAHVEHHTCRHSRVCTNIRTSSRRTRWLGMHAFFVWSEAANNFTFIYPQPFGKSATCRKKRRDRSFFLTFPLSMVTPLSPPPSGRFLITVSLINPLRVCAGMPELPGRLAGGTVRQVQREELQGSQLRLGALRGRWVWNSIRQLSIVDYLEEICSSISNNYAKRRLFFS